MYVKQIINFKQSQHKKKKTTTDYNVHVYVILFARGYTLLHVSTCSFENLCLFTYTCTCKIVHVQYTV